MDDTARQVVEIAANVDDVTAEVVGRAIDALVDAGALDVWATPITMKKSRPGLTVTLLARPDDRDRLARLLIELTGTFGVRYTERDRLTLDRRFESVDTAYGPIRMKIGALDGRDVVAKPEFDEADAAATKAGVPVRVVLDAARAAYHAQTRAGGAT